MLAHTFAEAGIGALNAALRTDPLKSKICIDGHTVLLDRAFTDYGCSDVFFWFD